jgi:hypothetical protein
MCLGRLARPTIRMVTLWSLSLSYSGVFEFRMFKWVPHSLETHGDMAVLARYRLASRRNSKNEMKAREVTNEDLGSRISLSVTADSSSGTVPLSVSLVDNKERLINVHTREKKKSIIHSLHPCGDTSCGK